MNILIIYAHKGEIRDLEDKLSSRGQTDVTVSLTSFRDLKKTENPDMSLKRHDLIINIGLAGRLRDDLPLGESYLISTMTDKYRSTQIDLSSEPFFDIAKKTINLDGRHLASLVTSDHPVIDTNRRRDLAGISGADLVDMEALLIYRIINVSSTPFLCVKLVSDSADDQAELMVLGNKKALSKKLSADLMGLIDQFEGITR